MEKHLVRFSFFHTFAAARPNLFYCYSHRVAAYIHIYARRSVNIAENWALVADGGHGNDAPLADYAHRAGEWGLAYAQT